MSPSVNLSNIFGLTLIFPQTGIFLQCTFLNGLSFDPMQSGVTFLIWGCFYQRMKEQAAKLRFACQRDSVTRWLFFEGLNILISTFCLCADSFQSPSKG
jgi:hypothetical protein